MLTKSQYEALNFIPVYVKGATNIIEKGTPIYTDTERNYKYLLYKGKAYLWIPDDSKLLNINMESNDISWVMAQMLTESVETEGKIAMKIKEIIEMRSKNEA